MAYYKKIRSRKARGRVIRSVAKSTKRGRGPIKKRKAYRKGMGRKK